MRFSQKIACSVVVSCGLTACNSLSQHEQQQYDNLISQGASPQTPHNPALAAGLNLLPGIGDLYNGEYGAFALDLLLWWPSVVWAVPQGAITADNYNKKATIIYYTVGPGAGQYDANKHRNATSK